VTPEVVSADSHVLEPHDLWTSRLAGGPFAGQAPHMVEDREGGHWFHIDGLRPFPIGLAGAAGKPSSELKASGVRAEELRSGGWDPVARLEDMGADGVAAEVLYPSVGMSLAQCQDPAYQLACIEAYNDWLIDYCAAGRGRLIGLALIPTVDVAAAVAEIHRCADAGLRGAMIPGLPASGHYAEPAYDPLWAAFAERGLPVSFHILTGHTGGDPTLGSGILMMTVMSVVHQIQQTISLLIFGGVFDRHPTLRVVSAEHDAGWVAHYAYRIDQMFERHRNWLGRGLTELLRPPIEYLRTNVWYTFQKDPVAVETRDRVGLTQLMWASDYPHSDSTWPHSQKVIERDFAGVPVEEVAMIVGGNARSLYGVAP
jgi:predicted TIM-barrel fold metal-dependent hydrolase